MTLDFCATQIGLEESWTCCSVLYWLPPDTSVAHPQYAVKYNIDFSANCKLEHHSIFKENW